MVPTQISRGAKVLGNDYRCFFSHQLEESGWGGADMEFVASGTSDTCVKYFGAGVKFSRINAKDLGQSFHKTIGVSLNLSR